MNERYSDSNYTLRFPRSYQEATGKRLSRYDFADEFPRARKRDAFLWCFIVATLSLVLYFITRT